MAEYRHTIKTKCKFCGNIFDSFNLAKVCLECSQNMNDYYAKIKDWKETYPDETAEEIAAELKIPEPIVKNFFREEQLQNKSKERSFVLRCKRCDKPIYKGRYCSACEIAETRMEMLMSKFKGPGGN